VVLDVAYARREEVRRAKMEGGGTERMGAARERRKAKDRCILCGVFLPSPLDVHKLNTHICALVTMGQERNLIDMRNSEGSTNPYRSKFDLEDPTGKTPIMLMFFLYPQRATSDSVPRFVDGATFGAHLAVMLPRGASALGHGREVRGSRIVSHVYDDEEEVAIGSRQKMRLWDVYRAAAGFDDGLDVKYGCSSFVGTEMVGRYYQNIQVLLSDSDYSLW